MSNLILTKFDVAERQLLQAINLFFQEKDAISIHTLSEAANQVLSDLGKSKGIVNSIKCSELVREDKKKEWRNILSTSKNFFKHADLDKDGIHEFKLMFNDFSLLEGVLMYHEFKKKWVPETIAFHLWFSAEYPDSLMQEVEGNPKTLSLLGDYRVPSPICKSIIREAIESHRNGQYSIERICLEYGL